MKETEDEAEQPYSPLLIPTVPLDTPAANTSTFHKIKLFKLISYCMTIESIVCPWEVAAAETNRYSA